MEKVLAKFLWKAAKGATDFATDKFPVPVPFVDDIVMPLIKEQDPSKAAKAVSRNVENETKDQLREHFDNDDNDEETGVLDGFFDRIGDFFESLD
ncbi:MAG: hypothetical protein F6K58_27760 [Symploca sp. SIO2E9]|nr:hypothetical protein [Symploca sp. SIO2E9]